MRVAVITSILPVPGLIADNDYVFQIENEVYKIQPSIDFKYFRPCPYLPLLKSDKWLNRSKTAKLGSYEIKERIIRVLPFWAIASKSFLFALSSQVFAFIYCKRLKQFATNVSLVHAHFIFADGALAYYMKKKYKIPYIISVQSEQRLFNNYFSARFAKKILDNASSIVCISPVMYKFLTEKNFMGLHQIGLGIDNSFLTSEKKNKQSKKPIQILTVGALYWVKNYEKTILAIGDLSAKYNISYTIVGKGQDEFKLKSLVSQNGFDGLIQFISSVPSENMATFMAQFDIFILASHKETWGRVYIEAMAVGLPVILTKNTGVFGIIQEGKDALVCNPKDINSIKASIEKLIISEELRNRLVMNGQNLAMAQTWSNIALKYTHIYNTILNQ